jgi:hypothetical protein
VTDDVLADALAGGLALLGVGAYALGRRRGSSTSDVPDAALPSTDDVPAELALTRDDTGTWRYR